LGIGEEMERGYTVTANVATDDDNGIDSEKRTGTFMERNMNGKGWMSAALNVYGCKCE